MSPIRNRFESNWTELNSIQLNWWYFLNSHLLVQINLMYTLTFYSYFFNFIFLPFTFAHPSIQIVCYIWIINIWMYISICVTALCWCDGVYVCLFNFHACFIPLSVVLFIHWFHFATQPITPPFSRNIHTYKSTWKYAFIHTYSCKHIHLQIKWCLLHCSKYLCVRYGDRK